MRSITEIDGTVLKHSLDGMRAERAHRGERRDTVNNLGTPMGTELLPNLSMPKDEESRRELLEASGMPIVPGTAAT